MNGRPALFFGLVALLTLPFYVLGAFGPDLTRILPIQLPISALMFVVPAVAALTLTAWHEGQAGVRALLGRTFDLPRSGRRRWLLVALLLMPFMLGLAYLLQRTLGQPLPAGPLPWQAVPGMFALFFMGAIGEELGWTGYATNPLQARHGALRGALLLGTCWALIHVIPYAQAHRSAHWIVWQCLGTVALRVIMVRMYNSAGKSVLTAMLFHTMINVSEFAFPDHGSHYDPRISALIYMGCAVLIWRAGGPCVTPWRFTGKPAP